MRDLNLYCARDFWDQSLFSYLVYKLKKIAGSYNFSDPLIKTMSRYKKIGYNINVLQQTAYLVVNIIIKGIVAFLFNCRPAGRTSDSKTVSTERLIYT